MVGTATGLAHAKQKYVALCKTASQADIDLAKAAIIENAKAEGLHQVSDFRVQEINDPAGDDYIVIDAIYWPKELIQ